MRLTLSNALVMIPLGIICVIFPLKIWELSHDMVVFHYVASIWYEYLIGSFIILHIGIVSIASYRLTLYIKLRGITHDRS